MVRLHWARARKTAFPYAEAMVAGPFETMAEGFEAVKRVAPFWPEAHVFYHATSVGTKKGAALLGGPRIVERTAAPD